MNTNTYKKLSLVAALALFILGAMPSALAQEEDNKRLGGHIGFVLPLVSHAGGTTTNDLADDFTIGFPLGVSFKGSGRMVYDLELVPALHEKAPRQTSLTIHPGLVWGLDHGWGAGARLAFDVNSPTWGFTPLVNHSWPIKDHYFKAYFIEAVLPVRFNRPTVGPKTDAVTFGLHFGVGF